MCPKIFWVRSPTTRQTWAGGDQMVQDAKAKRDSRESPAGPVLAGLGAWELDPRNDTDDLEAAAALCRSTGYWAVPYPVANGRQLIANTWQRYP